MPFARSILGLAFLNPKHALVCFFATLCSHRVFLLPKLELESGKFDRNDDFFFENSRIVAFTIDFGEGTLIA